MAVFLDLAPSASQAAFLFLLEAVQVQDGAVAIPFELLAAIVFGGILWAFKWLVGREFRRFEKIIEQHDRAIEVLQKSDTSQQFDLTQVARIEAAVKQLQKELSQYSKETAFLPKLAAGLERLQEANGQLNERVQRLDNVGFALKQTQELIQSLQKDLFALKASVASGYVSEEKYVRELTVLTSRVDAVWERIDGNRNRESYGK
ncbi:hypothetical protein [Vacuolonema iberomarrocanum]|uniref:hypothetical protein n=1 Tax=Vacuolonema iberomarrocanum TaxID=3454632 RepID=UPI0019DDDFC8|nr:hypothetical protein [filamentous cyanobacterium LEGE 07170]